MTHEWVQQPGSFGLLRQVVVYKRMSAFILGSKSLVGTGIAVNKSSNVFVVCLPTGAQCLTSEEPKAFPVTDFICTARFLYALAFRLRIRFVCVLNQEWLWRVVDILEGTFLLRMS